VDFFLCTLSYHELLGFIPEEPGSDTHIYAIREANAFRMSCEDSNAFLDDCEELHDSHSDKIRGGGLATMITNHVGTAAANWLQ
jgi:hypothetical protein